MSNTSASHEPEWYEGKMYDATFDAWRSTLTGHRVANGDGSPVLQTRELARRRPWLAPLELLHRYQAKSFGREVERLKSRGNR